MSIKEDKSKSKCLSLPKTRKEQFKRLLKDNYMKMVVFSMITFVFIVPLIVLFLVMNYNTSEMLKEENADVLNIVFSSCLWFSVYAIPCIAILSLGFAGLFSVCKSFVWDEPVSYSTFFMGIKKNFKEFLFIFYFDYLFFVLFLFTFARFYYLVSIPTIVRYILIFVSGLVFAIVFMMSLYMMSSATRYQSKIKDLIVNSFRLTFRNFLINILLAIMSLFLWVIAVIFNPIVESIVFLIMFVYLLSFFALIITSYHASIYDESVNKEKFPSIYRAGLDRNLD